MTECSSLDHLLIRSRVTVKAMVTMDQDGISLDNDLSTQRQLTELSSVGL